MNTATLAECTPKSGYCWIEPIDRKLSDVLLLPSNWRAGNFSDPRQDFGRVLAYNPNGHEPGFSRGDFVIFPRIRASHLGDSKGVLCLTKNSDVEAVVGDSIRLLGSRILVERDESETVSAGGIVLADDCVAKPETGVVRDVGPGKELPSGHAKMFVKPGDKVIFSKYGGKEVTVGDKTLLLMDVDCVLAVME